MSTDWVIREFSPNTDSSAPLNDKEVVDSKKKLVKIIKGTTNLNRRYVDPPIQGQTFGLVSFIPAQGVRANDKGFYGYVKFRGNYDNVPDCSTRIDDIIRNVDSTNHIHICRVGMPVPLVTQGYAKEVDEIDLKKDVEKDLSSNVRQKAMEDKKEMEEIEERAEALKRDVEEPDPQEAYNAKRTKLAVLRWTLQEHMKKINEIRELRENCVSELIDESKLHPEWEENHMERYMEARRKANIPEDQELPEFMALIRTPIVIDEEKIK